jgi:hypothetical protein
VSDLDQDRIDAAARWTAEQLARTGVAKVELTPGDSTVYKLLLSSPGPLWRAGGESTTTYYWVSLCASWGNGYEWAGGPIERTYCAEKWTNHSANKAIRAHTGEVIAQFLTATSKALRSAVDRLDAFDKAFGPEVTS